MTDAPKKRPWYRLHLSTAVVLMFVAAGLLWANLVGHTVEHTDWPATPGPYEFETFTWEVQYGWPWCCYSWYRTASPWSTSQPAVSTSVFCIVLNACVAVAVILCVGFLCEWRIRRRERRE